jgi:hypothetical protein
VPTTDRLRAKSRRESGLFHALPEAVLDSQNFRHLGPKACKLIFDLLRQLRLSRGGPKNNGDICIAWSLMKPCGWSSKQQLYEARDELEHYGFIVVTRQGGKNRPTLYGFTWWSIDYCDGKLDPPTAAKILSPPEAGRSQRRFSYQREKNPWSASRTKLVRRSYQCVQEQGENDAYWSASRTSQADFCLSVGPPVVPLLRATRPKAVLRTAEPKTHGADGE